MDPDEEEESLGGPHLSLAVGFVFFSDARIWYGQTRNPCWEHMTKTRVSQL